MQKGPVFPQELFDLTIDQCDDFETLRSCALVSSSFRDHARVFSHVRIGPLDKEHTVAQLQELLENSPSFAAGVKSLHLWDRTEGWMATALPGRFLSLLTSLTRLHISSTFDLIDAYPLCKSIRMVLSRPTLTCLELTDITLPITLLANCPGLRSLKLDWVSFGSNSHDNLDASIAACMDSCQAQLEDLSCSLHSDTFSVLGRWILHPKSPLKISCLRSFVCSVHDARANLVIQHFLGASALSLQHLGLKNGHHLSTTSILDLHELTALRTLSLEIWLDIVPPAQHLRLLSVLSLGNLVFPPLQQRLALVLTLHTNNGRREVVQLLAATDHVLAALPFITDISVTLQPRHVPLDEPQVVQKERLKDVSAAFVQEMPSLLDRLAGKGTLRILRSPRLPKWEWSKQD
ncbi:hypothetical protein K438DRAFT_1794999 [Mycena galopus ATCC 62051]|nr:hypothetical protein K438DRAFT_1794999 [Mycena galopus ATCC 62051]